MSGVMREAQVNLVSGDRNDPSRSVSLSKPSPLEVIDVVWHDPFPLLLKLSSESVSGLISDNGAWCEQGGWWRLDCAPPGECAAVTKGDGLAQQGLTQERKVSQDPEGRCRLLTRQWGPGPVRVAK